MGGKTSILAGVWWIQDAGGTRLMRVSWHLCYYVWDAINNSSWVIRFVPGVDRQNENAGWIEGLYLFVSGVNQGIEGGKWVQNFLVLPQGFGSFPEVFSPSKQPNLVLGECLQIMISWFLLYWRMMLLWVMDVEFNYTCTVLGKRNVSRIIPRIYGCFYKILRLSQSLVKPWVTNQECSQSAVSQSLVI